MSPATLDLETLGRPPGLPALSPAKGLSYAEAAAVCLEEKRHAQGVCISVKGVQSRTYCLAWPPVTDQVRRTYGDLQDATCDGAYGIAIVVAREVTGLTILHQAWKGGGFDYWLGETVDDLFQNASRLEVSGILSGDDTKIKSRVKKKKKQTEQSDDTGLPAYACVVEFSRPEAHLVKR